MRKFKWVKLGPGNSQTGWEVPESAQMYASRQKASDMIMFNLDLRGAVARRARCGEKKGWVVFMRFCGALSKEDAAALPWDWHGPGWR